MGIFSKWFKGKTQVGRGDVTQNPQAEIDALKATVTWGGANKAQPQQRKPIQLGQGDKMTKYPNGYFVQVGRTGSEPIQDVDADHKENFNADDIDNDNNIVKGEKIMEQFENWFKNRDPELFEAIQSENELLSERKGGKWIQKSIKHPGRCEDPGDSKCPAGSPQYNLAMRFKHGDLHKDNEKAHAKKKKEKKEEED